MRSGFVPVTLEEIEVCKLEAGIQTCRESFTYIEGLGDYTKEEFELMKTIIHDRKPLFNIELTNKYTRVLPELKNRPVVDIEERRMKHSDTRFIKEFLSERVN